MERQATVDRMIEAIREADKPALTKQDIADVVGVSWQTINNHEEELDAEPRVRTGKVGKAKVFWLAADDDPNELNGEPEAPDVGGEPDVSGEAPGRPSDDTSTQTRVERLAQPRVPSFGAVFLALAVVLAPLGANMAVGGAILPGFTMLVLAGFCLVTGTGLVLVAAVANWYLERPLKALFTGGSGDVAPTEVGND